MGYTIKKTHHIGELQLPWPYVISDFHLQFHPMCGAATGTSETADWRKRIEFNFKYKKGIHNYSAVSSPFPGLRRARCATAVLVPAIICSAAAANVPYFAESAIVIVLR